MRQATVTEAEMDLHPHHFESGGSDDLAINDGDPRQLMTSSGHVPAEAVRHRGIVFHDATFGVAYPQFSQRSSIEMNRTASMSFPEHLGQHSTLTIRRRPFLNVVHLGLFAEDHRRRFGHSDCD